MKKLMLLLAAMFVYAGVQAQEEDTSEAKSEKAVRNFYHTSYKTRNSGAFGKNTVLLSLSYGVPNTLYSSDYIFGTEHYNATGAGIGPLILRLEFAVHDEIGIGIYAQGATKSWKEYGRNENAIGVGGGVLGLYHFNKWIPISKLDVYAGIGVDIHHDMLSKVVTFYPDNPGIIFNPIVVVGARYYFSKAFGVFVELGDTGFSYANGGITLRLGNKPMHHKKRKGTEPRHGGPGE